MTYREDKPHLRAFEPGNSRNTLLRLTAEVLGIPLYDPRTGQKPLDTMSGHGKPFAASKWANMEIQNAGAQQFAAVRPKFSFAVYDTDERQPPMQYAQAAPDVNNRPNLQRSYRSFEEMDNSPNPVTLEQGLVLERLMNLSSVPQRPFKEDFPDGYKADSKTGRMMTDVDGRLINPNAVIVGRAFENQDDVSLSDENADKLIKQLTGHGISYDYSKNNAKSLSRYIPNQAGTRFGQIAINPDLPDEFKIRTKRHEIGHLFDHIGGTLNDTLDDVPNDVAEEFFAIYNEQKNPFLGFERLRNPYVNPQDVAKGKNWLPLFDGYKTGNEEDEGTDQYQDERRGELFAEGVRAYLTDPNAMKAKYPLAAKYLRKFINTHPILKQYIHLSDNRKNVKANPYFAIAEQRKNT